jgi:hypothetical protein
MRARRTGSSELMHINVMPAFSVMRRVKEEEQGRGSTIAINGVFYIRNAMGNASSKTVQYAKLSRSLQEHAR